MIWVISALLGTQVILILMAAERRAMLVEIVEKIGDRRVDLVLAPQIGGVVEELRRIGDRAADGGQARWDELQRIRKLLEDQTR